MRAFLLSAVLLAVGLFVAVNERDSLTRATLDTESADTSAGPVSLREARSSIAAHRDRGQLLAYDSERRVVHSGASTWHPVRISEAHALRAIDEGGMTIQAPNGAALRLRYTRHVEHPDGNWTWIGREEGSAPGTETILTFGQAAVFGTIRQGKADLSLTTERGSAWLVETDYSRSDLGRTVGGKTDFLIPGAAPMPMASSAPQPLGAISAAAEKIVHSMQAPPVASDLATASAPVVVDLAMGYTTGFATRLGGESQARTRLHFLVDVTNEAYAVSGVNAQVRLVHSMQVGYPDGNVNFSALFDLSGLNCTEETNGERYMSSSRWNCTPVARPAALQPLAAARESYGADVLVLVRKFEATSESCGLAWMLGGGQNAIDPNSAAAFGMTVVNDTSGSLFPDNNITCPDWQMAHELGHIMGQQHDLVTAMGSDDTDNNGSLLDAEEFGRHPYSFGYSTDNTGSDVCTIMSNRRPSQTRYRVFANPLISSCGGAPCGTVTQEDNVRSMNEVMPTIAAFRTNRIFGVGYSPNDMDGDGQEDIVWYNQNSREFYSWLMNGATPRVGQSGGFGLLTTSPIAMGDFNDDGRSDVLLSNGQLLYMYTNNGAGGFNAAFVAGAPVGWEVLGASDVNADGKTDLIWFNPSTRELYYWLMDGSNPLSGHSGGQIIGGTSPMATGDFGGDGRADVLLASSDHLYMLTGTNAGTFAASYTAPLPIGWSLLGARDVDADNKADLIWYHPVTRELYSWSMNGNAPSAGRSGGTVLGGTTPLRIGDYNGDHRADILLTSGPHLYMFTGAANGTYGAAYVAPYPAGWSSL